jgi:outer membrane receptor protein involved in Fe transport
LKTPNRCISATTSCLAASTLAILASAAAQAQPASHWDLPGQPLADSLREVAARTDSNILFDGKLVDGQEARPLKTKASADEALTHLLAGTGLTYRHLDERTVTIQLASAQDSRPATSVIERRSDLAQEAISIEEIVVTGTQIRGIENNTAPLVVLSRQYIDSTGFGTTAKLIESLPQNFALANQSGLGTPGVSDSGGEQGVGINLRGIGEGTTLVLVNGRRLAPGFRSAAVDISALPLGSLERVEVLTDGASALYGADAVGGVVNFILREDFEGAETRLRSGVADGGVNEYRVNQSLGNAWGSGNALLSLDYYKRDALLTADRDFVSTDPVTGVQAGTLLPEDENYSGVFTGKQQFSDTVAGFADLLYTQRDSINQASPLSLVQSNESDNSQAIGTVGVQWDVGGDWQIEVAGTYGQNELSSQSRSIDGSNDLALDTMFESESAQIKADGTVFTLPGGNVRMAIGADWRSESYEDTSTNTSFGLVTASTDMDQIVRSAFTEFYIPVFGESNAVTGVRSLELSLAGRYDDYSSFGSSFDPQYGLMWEPVAGLRLRGRHGTSYKAPNLADYTLANNVGAAFLNIDPVLGASYQLQLLGADVASFVAQESESSSFGLEFRPSSEEGVSASLNYYRIKYRNRIANPPGTVLNDPLAYGSLFTRNPSVAQVNQAIALAQLGLGFFPFTQDGTGIDPNFDPASVQVLVDLRRRNLSVVDTDGLDLSTQYAFGVGRGRVALGLNATYVLDIELQATTTSAPDSTVGTYLNPPDWRARAYVSWQLEGWSSSLFVNHTDSYTDDRTPTALVPIDSYTTVDARLAYDFSNRFPAGFLSGVIVAANVQNVLDEDPPATAVLLPSVDRGFDVANANPLGRFVALEISKKW